MWNPPAYRCTQTMNACERTHGGRPGGRHIMLVTISTSRYGSLLPPHSPEEKVVVAISFSTSLFLFNYFFASCGKTHIKFTVFSNVSVPSSVVFSPFMLLCNHHHHPSPELFSSFFASVFRNRKKNPPSILQYKTLLHISIGCNWVT